MLVDHLQKSKERIQKFKETGDSQYIYQNEINKACFQYEMAYWDSTDLTTEKVPDEVNEVSIGHKRNSRFFVFAEISFFFKILLVTMWKLCSLEVIIKTCHSESKCFWEPKYVIIDYFRSYATIRSGWGDVISKGTAVILLSYYCCLKMNKNKS